MVRCHVRTGLRPHLFPTAFIACRPRWSLKVLSGPPMCSGLFPSRSGLGCDCWDSAGSGVHPRQGSLLIGACFGWPHSAHPGPAQFWSFS